MPVSNLAAAASPQEERLLRVHGKTLARTWQQSWQCWHLAHVRLERLDRGQTQRLQRVMTLRLWGYCLACVRQGGHPEHGCEIGRGRENMICLLRHHGRPSSGRRRAPGHPTESRHSPKTIQLRSPIVQHVLSLWQRIHTGCTSCLGWPDPLGY